MTTPDEAYREKILEKLHLIHDEPDSKSELFGFGKYAKDLAELVMDPKTHTPYAIGLHGEWGSGKTSLVKQASEMVEKSIQEKGAKDTRVIWFEAWKYERVDPMAALLQRIALEYANDKSDKFWRAVKGVALVFSDIMLRANTGLSLGDVERYFESSVEEIPTVTDKLEDMIGKGRLIVFIDDLDRVDVTKALGILEAIKLFLNAKGAIFVVAVDMKKIERAWELRYRGVPVGVVEGRDHVDKIFQLKLSLPPKNPEALSKYIDGLVGFLEENERKLITEGCPPNPRKIKRILNLVYFLVKSSDSKEFKTKFPLLTIWSIATVAFPDLAKIIKSSPRILVELALVCNHCDGPGDLRAVGEEKIRTVISKETSVNFPNHIAFTYKQIVPQTVDGLLYVMNDEDAFRFLKAVGAFYNLKLGEGKDFVKESKEWYIQISDRLGRIIYQAGLIA